MYERSWRLAAFGVRFYMTLTVQARFRSASLALGATAVFSFGGGDAARRAASEPARNLHPDTVNVVNQKPVWRDTAELVPQSTVGIKNGPDNYLFSKISAIAVGPAGQVFVADGGYHVVREFRRGDFVRTVGKTGKGPGEFTSVMGLAVMPNGRLLVRDFETSRINVFAPDGKPVTQWPVPPGDVVGHGRSLLRMDSAGRVLAAMWVGLPKDLRMSGNALLRLSSDGARRDTFVVSDRYVANCPVVMVTAPKPIVLSFAPQTVWTVGSRGEIIVGCSKQYSFDVIQPSGRVLRVTRAWTPVPISKLERDDRVADFERRVRENAIPGWKWTSPPHPTHHPAYSGFFAAEDGRIWVITSLPGEAMDNPAGPTATPPRAWRDHYNFDVFDARGVFQGSVRIPEGMRLTTEPVIRGDTVWAVRTDDRGTPFVTKYLLTRGK